MGWTSRADVERWFGFAEADFRQRERMLSIQLVAMQLGKLILNETPACADQSAAIRKIREAVLIANDAILREKPSACGNASADACDNGGFRNPIGRARVQRS